MSNSLEMMFSFGTSLEASLFQATLQLLKLTKDANHPN